MSSLPVTLKSKEVEQRKHVRRTTRMDSEEVELPPQATENNFDVGRKDALAFKHSDS